MTVNMVQSISLNVFHKRFDFKVLELRFQERLLVFQEEKNKKAFQDFHMFRYAEMASSLVEDKKWFK